MVTPALPQSVQDLIDREFGFPTTEAETATTVGTAVAQLVSNNPKRVALVVVNLSTGALFIGLDRATSSTRGLRLATGGSVSMNYNDDFTLPAREWFIIGDGAGLAFYALEVLMI